MSSSRTAVSVAALWLATAGCDPAKEAEHPRRSEARDDGPPARFTLHALDVGTGLSILVRGEDFTLLYDGGSNDDRKTGAQNRVVAYLALLLGASNEADCHPEATPPGSEAPRINHLFLSHPHRDHLELLPDVLRCYAVASVWEPGAAPSTVGYARFRSAVDLEAGARVHRATEGAPALRAGATIALGRQASAFVLSARPEEKDLNDTSIVMRLDLGGARVLFTGDATGGERRDPGAPPDRGSVEQTLLAEMPAELAANVLIVGHHGSKTSTRRAFLDAVRPQTAVVSSGPMQYGSVVLPDPEILALLEGSGARVLRTDEDDEGCRAAERKVGADADGAPGGCSAFTLTIVGDDVEVAPGPLAD